MHDVSWNKYRCASTLSLTLFVTPVPLVFDTLIGLLKLQFGLPNIQFCHIDTHVYIDTILRQLFEVASDNRLTIIKVLLINRSRNP